MINSQVKNGLYAWMVTLLLFEFISTAGHKHCLGSEFLFIFQSFNIAKLSREKWPEHICMQLHKTYWFNVVIND